MQTRLLETKQTSLRGVSFGLAVTSFSSLATTPMTVHHSKLTEHQVYTPHAAISPLATNNREQSNSSTVPPTCTARTAPPEFIDPPYLPAALEANRLIAPRCAAPHACNQPARSAPPIGVSLELDTANKDGRREGTVRGSGGCGLKLGRDVKR